MPLRDKSVDLIVTSPPYNCGVKYGVYDDDADIGDWLSLLARTWKECVRVLKPGGRLCVNVPFGTGRNPFVPIGAVVQMQIHDCFGSVDGIVVWDKGTTGNRTSWGSWRSPVAPVIRDQAEIVIIASAQGKFVAPKYNEGYSPWLSSDRFTEYTRNVWSIAPETHRSGHPAPFPVGLAERCIRLFGYPGSVVLDPFAGSGTVGVAATALGANSVLIDVDLYYCKGSKHRCEGVNMSLVGEVWKL